jgi:O-antigen/teichoic acid export membrane protein
MSRSRRFAHSLVSGYVLLAVNILYTLVQGRMLLQFIKDDNEIGLWAVAIQVAGYFLLLDLGMAGISRILIDYKDDVSSTAYGSTIQTGFIVFLIQGALIAVSGAVISQWLPEITTLSKGDEPNMVRKVAIAAEQMAMFRSLVMWQCVLIGASFAGRISGFILEAHQRHDVTNYAQAAGFSVNLLTLWWCFEKQLGLYSLIWSNVASTLFVNVYSFVAVCHLGFLPGRGRWGRASIAKFREIFAYATDIFLLAVGNMLITASQVVVVTYTLGAAAAAVWSFATKTFSMSLQIVTRIYNYSSSAFAEMLVRGEMVRLRVRFRDLVVLTAAVGAWVTMSVALCNQSFVTVWTATDRMTWRVENDFLMGIYILTFTTTRCHVGLVSLTKNLRAMKFVYAAEGIAFIALASLLGQWLGYAGIIMGGIVTNLSFSGLYGMYRTKEILEMPLKETTAWLSQPLRFLAVMFGVALTLRFATLPLPVLWQLITNGIVAVVVGGFFFWKLGLPDHLQKEIGVAINKLRGRFLKQV